MELQFTTDFKAILNKVDNIDPLKYGRTRNYINGDVTYLSPYISRGIISTKLVLERVLANGFKQSQMESFVKELCWRDYFQRVGQTKDLNYDIKQPQQPVINHGIPSTIINAKTGITGIDHAIEKLYSSGYMHNHCRMYTASVVCNIAKSYWLHPSKWMYYHLLDGDFASNACSWQWVAAANSNKKYYANQENINKFTNSNQYNTFLDKTYEELEQIALPSHLKDTEKLALHTILPQATLLHIDNNLPTFIYNYYNLDPLWHDAEVGNRILILDPDFFKLYPVSKKCIDFVLDLSKNITSLQVYIGTFEALAKEHHLHNIFYKEHPLNVGYAGTEEPRDWIVNTVEGYFPSFFSYWKKVEKHI